MTILVGLVLWTLVACILAPPIGWILKRQTRAPED